MDYKTNKEHVDFQSTQEYNDKNKKRISRLQQNRVGFQTGNGSYKKTGVRYHEVHIDRFLHKQGFRSKVLHKRFVNTIASKKDKRKFKSKTDI